MKSLKEIKESFIGGLNYSGEDAAKNATYADMTMADRKILDDYCNDNFAKPFMDSTFQEQSAARSVLDSDPEEVQKQNDKDKIRESKLQEADEETDPDAEEDKKDDSETEISSPEEEEKKDEDKFVDMLNDQEFIEAITNATTQYISENMLGDEYNSFAIVPYIEFTYNDLPYGLSIEFESAVTINIDKDGKVFEKDVPSVDQVKYKTPEMDEMTILEDITGKTTIDLLIKDIVKGIKKVAR